MIRHLGTSRRIPTLSTSGRFYVFPAHVVIQAALFEPVAGLRREKIDASFLTMFTIRTRKTVAFNGLFLGLVVVVVALVNGTVAS